MVTYPDEPVTQINYARYAPSIQPQPQGSLFDAAFRQENDVVNAMEYLSRPDYPEQENFDLMTRAKTSAYFQQTPESFFGVRSDAAFDAVEARLTQETADRQQMAASGASGIFAAMVAGVLSPTILLPVGAGATAAKVSGAAVKSAAWVAFGAAVQEGVLQINQDQRTLTESLIGVGSAAALGAVLGGAARYLAPGEAIRIAEGMAHVESTMTIRPLEGPPAVGLSAQATPADLLGSTAVFQDPGGIASGVGIASGLKALGVDEKFIPKAFTLEWLGPITRGISAANSVYRSTIAQFGNAGLQTDAARLGKVVAEDGYIEQLIKQHDAEVVRLNRKQKKVFGAWFSTAAKNTEFKARYPDHTYKDFLEDVGLTIFDTLQGTRAADVPAELASLADDYIESVFRREIREAKDVGIDSWVQLKDENFALRVATQRPRHDLLSRDSGAARTILVENAMEVLAKQADDARMKGSAQVDDFVAGVIGKGSKTTSLTEEEARNIAEDIVEQLLPTLMGEYGRHGGIDILNQFGESAAKYIYVNPTKKWSNGRAWSEFLEKDIEKLSRSYIRTMAPDVELFRKFGVTEPAKRVGPDVIIKESAQKPFWKQFVEEQNALRLEAEKITDEGKRAKVTDKIHRETKQFKEDLVTLVERIRHTRGQPANPADFGFRLARGALQLNTQRLMGGVVIASIADPARIVMTAGLLNTFKHGFAPLLKGLKDFKMAMREIHYAGTANDVFKHGRSGMMFDLFEEMDHGNMLERFMQFGTSKIGIVALFDYWNTGMKMFAGSVWAGTLSDAINASAAGKATKWQKTFLASANIDEGLAKAMDNRIRFQKGGAETSPGVWMPNTEDWSQVSDELIEETMKKKYSARQLREFSAEELEERQGEVFRELQAEGRQLQRTFRSALAQRVDDTIVTPGVERPSWVDNSTPGRLIAQFRSFTLSSTMKTAWAMGQDVRVGRMAPAVVGSSFALALGTFSYYTWAMSVGGRAKEQMLNELEAAINGDEAALRRWADEAVNRSGLTGVFSELQKFGERIPGVRVNFAGQPATRSPFVHPVLDAFGPTANLIGNVDKIVMSASDPTATTFRAARQLMPYQNLMFVRQAFDRINELVMEKAGVAP